LNRLNHLALRTLATLSLLATGARAQECVHPPVMLPALSGPPVWKGTAGSTDFRPQLHDPRWSGAPVRLFSDSVTGVGALYNGQYRVLVFGSTLYVSMQVIADANVDPSDAADAVYFGFTDGPAPATGGYLLAIRPNRTGAAVPAPGAGVPTDPSLPIENVATDVNWYQTTDHTQAPPVYTPHLQNYPSWLSDVVTWNNSPGVAWAITFKVDLSVLGISGPQEFFFGERIGNGGGTTFKLGNSALAATNGASIGGGTIVLPEQNTWVDFQAPGTACTSGVSLTYDHVGVWSGGMLTNTVQACGGAATPCTPPDDTNTFRAELQNVPNTLGPTNHAVRAKFRIADWGSTIANWKLAPWKDIPGYPAGVFTDLTLPANFTWSFTAGGGGFGDAIIQYTCDVQGADGYCPKLTNPDGYHHQCMLVELGAGPETQTLTFQTAAVYRNMEFQGLSTLDRKARIDVKGLQQLLGQAGDRDVYLHVQTLNMPAHGKEPIWLPSKAMALARRYAEHPPALLGQPVPDVGNEKKGTVGKVAAPAKAGAPKAPSKPGDKAAQLAPAPKPSEPPAPAGQAAAQRFPNPKLSVFDVPVMTPSQALESVYPTYKIYPYVDTGKTSTIDGQVYKEVDPMVPFGYYLEHDGPLFGFSHLLEGVNGLVVTQVTENLYKVRVANEGSVEVSTKVTAEERPKGDTQPPVCPTCPPHGRCNCDVPGAPVASGGWLAAAGVLGLAALGRRSRRRRNRLSR
jgi:hypothetical protein